MLVDEKFVENRQKDWNITTWWGMTAILFLGYSLGLGGILNLIAIVFIFANLWFWSRIFGICPRCGGAYGLDSLYRGHRCAGGGRAASGAYLINRYNLMKLFWVVVLLSVVIDFHRDTWEALRHKGVALALFALATLTIFTKRCPYCHQQARLAWLGRGHQCPAEEGDLGRLLAAGEEQRASGLAIMARRETSDGIVLNYQAGTKIFLWLGLQVGFLYYISYISAYTAMILMAALCVLPLALLFSLRCLNCHERPRLSWGLQGHYCLHEPARPHDHAAEVAADGEGRAPAPPEG